jgi:hypothetical protein
MITYLHLIVFHYTLDIIVFIASGNPLDYNSLTCVSLDSSNAYYFELLDIKDRGGDVSQSYRVSMRILVSYARCLRSCT